MSKSAQLTLTDETDITMAQVKALANVAYANADIGAAIGKGSFRASGTVVVPCSVKTLSEIASGVTGSSLARAADFTLTARRLVLILREIPLHLGHLRSTTAVTEADAIVSPPVLAFHARPTSIDDMIKH